MRNKPSLRRQLRSQGYFSKVRFNNRIEDIMEDTIHDLTMLELRLHISIAKIEILEKNRRFQQT